jgi:CHAD domain-containing protein
METLHEWRKRVKYHRYHAALLTPTWPGPMRARRDELKTLSDVTGDAHDLAEFVELLEEERLLDAATTAAVRAAATDRRRDLETEARPLGERLFVEHPDDLVARFRGYWQYSAD